MKLAKNIVTTASLLLLSTALLGCATPTKPTRERPQWTMHGDGLFIAPGRVLYGVGIGRGIKEKRLSYSTALNRARGVAMTFLNDFCKTILIPYSGKEHEWNYPRYRDACMRAQIMAGMQHVDTWVDPNDGSFYALVRAKFDPFLDELLKNREYSRRDHEYFTKNADRVFNKVAGKHAKGYAEGDWP